MLEDIDKTTYSNTEQIDILMSMKRAQIRCMCTSAFD